MADDQLRRLLANRAGAGYVEVHISSWPGWHIVEDASGRFKIRIDTDNSNIAHLPNVVRFEFDDVVGFYSLPADHSWNYYKVLLTYVGGPLSAGGGRVAKDANYFPYPTDKVPYLSDTESRTSWMRYASDVARGTDVFAELKQQYSERNSMAWMFPLIMFILSFVLTKLSGGSDRTALGVAAAAAGASYLAAEHTQVGADISKSVDDFFGVGAKDPTGTVGSNGAGTSTKTDADGKVITTPTTVTSGANGTGASGLGSTLAGVWNGLGAAGQAVVAGVGAVGAVSFFDKYGLWILGGVGLWLVIKD